jgi:hypothetical protein
VNAAESSKPGGIGSALSKLKSLFSSSKETAIVPPPPPLAPVARAAMMAPPITQTIESDSSSGSEEADDSEAAPEGMNSQHPCLFCTLVVIVLVRAFQAVNPPESNKKVS